MDGSHNDWYSRIAHCRSVLSAWYADAETADQAFLDTEGATSYRFVAPKGQRYNLFWANTTILQAALYSRIPEPAVSRTFQDPHDDISRVAATMLERVLHQQEYFAHDSYKQVVEDRLIPGMGQLWVRYAFDEDRISDELFSGWPVVADQRVYTDYVYWKDFYFEPVRNWKDVTWVARRIWMTRREAERRWPGRHSHHL